MTGLLLQYVSLNEHQLKLIGSKIQKRVVQSGEYFSQAGTIANEIAFVSEGIFRVCYYDKDFNEITRYFVDEDNFLVDLNSYNHQIPSSEYIQAVTDTVILLLTRRDLDELSNTIIGWDKATYRIATEALMEKVSRISPLLAEDATTRYLNFIEAYPQIANRIPLSYLASYLGVTQQSLSRIRKSIRKSTK